MKNTFVLCLGLILLAGCGGGDDDSAAQRTVLRVGTDATYPPFETVDPETGRPGGFDIDLMTAVCQINGWRPQFIVTPFDGIIPGLRSKKYDAVISAMTITPERAAVVDFSYPYYLAGQTIAVPLDDSVTQGVDDLTGKRVGVQLGTTGELMAKKMDGLHVFSYDNIGAAFIDMANGNLDAVLNDFPTSRAYISKHGTAKTVGKILSTEYYGIAVRKGDAQLLTEINSALDELRDTGRYDRLHEKWFGGPPAQGLAIDSSILE
ncbi:MAG: basic amino acid ABC transporter substrate-binding protein [Candidatus Zixiibacteriota bacterium]|nr:MAG: basic amino acid ABC transporter substrate-binding protein [candidate division Zixibacteria bacterium]